MVGFQKSWLSKGWNAVHWDDTQWGISEEGLCWLATARQMYRSINMLSKFYLHNLDRLIFSTSPSLTFPLISPAHEHRSSQKSRNWRTSFFRSGAQSRFWAPVMVVYSYRVGVRSIVKAGFVAADWSGSGRLRLLYGGMAGDCASTAWKSAFVASDKETDFPPRSMERLGYR